MKRMCVRKAAISQRKRKQKEEEKQSAERREDNLVVLLMNILAVLQLVPLVRTPTDSVALII